MSELTEIKNELAEIRAENAEMKSMLRRLVNPVGEISAREKGRAAALAFMAGDDKKYQETVKKLNG